MTPMVRTHEKGMIQFKDWPQEVHPERLWVVNNLGDTKDKPLVLDVGCGTHKSLEEAVGVDLIPGADVQRSLDDLPFEAHSVDAIISRHSLEHVLDPVKALREWHRVLKASGKVLIVLPDHGAVDTMQAALSGGVHLHAYSMASFSNLLSVIPWFTIEKLEIVLEDWSFGAILRPVEAP